MIGGVTRLGGLPGLPGRVTLSAGVTIKGFSQNQTPRNTTRDAFINKYMCPRINLSSFSRCELGTPLLKLLNCKRNNNLKKPHPSTLGL